MKIEAGRLISLICIILLVLSIGTFGAAQGRASFYLATDKSFGSAEMPEVNLEGPGKRSYDFRIYRINKPEMFLVKKVKERLVQEKNDEAYGNPFALFKKTLHVFKSDFRKIARREFSSRTRASLRKLLDVDFSPPREKIELAVPALLKDHKFLISFTVAPDNMEWSYRRVPIPAKEDGVYLVEVVSGSSLAHTVVVKSNIAFVTKQASSQTLVYVAARDTGAPMKDARVSILDGKTGAEIESDETDAGGIVACKKRTPSKSLVVVRHGDAYAISDPGFYSKSFYGDGGTRAFLYTERPIYRPGQDVYFKGIVRSFSGDSYRVSSGSASLDVITEQGDSIIRDIPVTIGGDAGTFHGEFTLPAEKNQYLGTYHLVLNFKGKTYSTEFAVEAYKKPSFVVKVRTAKKSYLSSDTVPVSISAKYYYGSPLSGARVHYRVFRRKKFDFSPVGKLPYFEAAAEYLGFQKSAGRRDLVVDKEDTLDNDGSLVFKVKPEKGDEDFVYSAIATVIDSNSSISGSSSFSVNRSAFFIRVERDNMVYNPGDTITITARLIPFDKSLKKTAIEKVVGNREVEAGLFSRSFHGIAQEAKRKELASKEVVTNSEGVAAFKFKIPEKGHYVINLSSEDGEGSETTAETTIWASQKSDSIQVPFKNLTLKPGKDIYSVGDEAEVLILSPVADGYILLTLEGSRIFQHKIIKLKGNSFKHGIKIKSSMSPNFTLSAIQLHGDEVYKSQVKIVAPPRDKFISVKITPSRTVYRPGDEVVLKVETTGKGKHGVSAEVSVGVVDQAIYQLREDRNPRISTYFYHPRRNNVNTTLSSAYRFFSYSEARRLKLALARKVNEPLGALKDESAKSRKRFKDTSYWSARIKTNSSGKATVKFVLAENLTTWRITAIAVTHDTRVGQGKTSIVARKKLMLLEGIPRYLIRADKQKISAHIANLTKKALETEVAISASGAEVIGKKSQRVSVGPGKRSMVYFTIQPTEKADVKFSRINLKVTSGSLYDGVVRKIPLKYFGQPQTITKTVRLASGDDDGDMELDLPKKSTDPRLALRLSPGSGEALRQSLSYLVGYPYGCVEQTMSRFMPLFAAKKAGYLSPRLKKELPKMVSQGLSLLKQHQSNDGGFGWFGEKGSDPMMSAYVYWGLSICSRYYKGMDQSMLSKARRFLYSKLDRSSLTPFQKAYILFALSEKGKVEKSMIDKLVGGAAGRGAFGKALTALVCINSGDKRGEDIFNDALDDSGFRGKKGLIFASLEPVENWKNDRVETASMLLLGAARLSKDAGLLEELESIILVNRKGAAWKNSRDTALAVIALSEKLEFVRRKAESAAISVTINNTAIKSFEASPDTISSGDAFFTISIKLIKKGANSIGLKKEGGVPLYASALLTYFDRSEHFESVEKGFSVKRAYYQMKGVQEDSGMSFDASSASEFAIGDLIMVELQIERTGKADSYIIVEDPIAPGFSFENMDAEYYSGDRKREYADRQAYDDRAVFFVTGPVESATVRYFLRSDIPGKYRILPARAALMYYPEVYGGSPDDRLSIKE